MAKIYGIPMPDLSSVGMRKKAEKKIDSWMKEVRNSDSLVGSKCILDAAQFKARQYGLSIPELSLDDVERIRQREQEYLFGGGKFAG